MWPGFSRWRSAKVLDCDGNSAHGNTRLGTVRDTYLEDDGEEEE